VKTKPDAKDALVHKVGVDLCAGCRGSLLSRSSHRHCRHRCERPLRMDAPSTGWVTVLAGLLARGSPPIGPAFPVAQWPCWTLGSPLTVAGAATATFEFEMLEFQASAFPLLSPESPGEPTP